MRWRPCRREKGTASLQPEQKPAVPLPDNPYRRFYTKTPTFEDLVRRAKEKGDKPD